MAHNVLHLNETKQAAGSSYSGKLTYRIGNDKNGVEVPEEDKSTQKVIEIVRENGDLKKRSSPKNEK